MTQAGKRGPSMLRNLTSALRITLAALAGAACTTVVMAAPTTESIDATIERALQAFRVPGMTVAVVHYGEVV